MKRLLVIHLICSALGRFASNARDSQGPFPDCQTALCMRRSSRASTYGFAESRIGNASCIARRFSATPQIVSVSRSCHAKTPPPPRPSDSIRRNDLFTFTSLKLKGQEGGKGMEHPSSVCRLFENRYAIAAVFDCMPSASVWSFIPCIAIALIRAVQVALKGTSKVAC